MSNYPENFSVRLYDAAQGRDDLGDDDAEIQWVERALTKLHEATDMLASVDHSNRWFNADCHEVSEAVAALAARVKEAMP